MERLHITGFDSAWGGTQRGAMCDLWIDKHSGEVGIDNAPTSVTWREAIQRVDVAAQHSHHIFAIDQGLVVPNDNGMRPVEKMLAKALVAMHCSAYPSNRSNESCYGASAGIWAFLAQLQRHGYLHKPMSIPNSVGGRYFFECYPHPTIIALLNRSKVLKYKCRHRNEDEWNELVSFLKGLPVRNLSTIVEGLSFQNKANEDKLDSIVCAYTAVRWWMHGTSQSSMIGDMESGYIVTPHSDSTLKRFKKVFAKKMNDDSGGTPPSPVAVPAPPLPPSPKPEHSEGQHVSSEDTLWVGPVELVATDTTNLARNIRVKKGKPAKVINDWMDFSRLTSHRLVVKFSEEDGEPKVAFVSHTHSADQKTLTADSERQPGLWFLMVAGASKESPLRFPIMYTYQPLD